jgi:CheY-like chemotaxis protein
MIAVLLVDDDPSLFNITRILLEKEGEISVDLCNSGYEALEILKNKSYDAIVSDYGMPEMNGIDFLREVKRRYPSVPFIMFTGQGTEQTAIDTFMSGGDSYVSKRSEPARVFNELKRVILHVTGEKKKRSEEIRGEEYLHLAMEVMSEPLWVTDPALKILYHNTAAGRITGTARTLIGHSFLHELTPASVEYLFSCFQDYFRTASSGTGNSPGPLAMVLECITTPGHPLKIDIQADISPDSAGRPQHFVFLGRVPRERKIVSHDLAQSPDLLQ